MEDLISVTGVRLHTVHWPPQGEPKAAVFVSHGVAEHSGRYEVLAKSLNQRGYLVVAHDHVGHGLSEGDRVHIDTIETYARDVIQHVERLKVQHPTLPVFLFGHSMGGTVASYTTILRQDLFCGLILSAPALEDNPETTGFFIKLAARVIAVFSPQAGVKSVSIETLSRIPEVVEEYRSDPLVYHGKLKAKWAVAMLNAMEFFGQHFSEISIPLLLVHGDADQLVHIGSSQFGYHTASSTDKTFEIFKGGFHETLNDLERDRFLLLVGEWLDRQFDAVARSAAGEGTAAEQGEVKGAPMAGESPEDAPKTGEPPTDVPPEDAPKAGDPPTDVPPEDAPAKDEGTVETESTENVGQGEGPQVPPVEGEAPNDELLPEDPQPSEQQSQGAVEDRELENEDNQ